MVWSASANIAGKLDTIFLLPEGRRPNGRGILFSRPRFFFLLQDLRALLLQQFRVPLGLGFPIARIGHERRERFPRLALGRHGAEQNTTELVDLRRRLEVARGRRYLGVAHRRRLFGSKWWCFVGAVSKHF